LLEFLGLQCRNENSRCPLYYGHKLKEWKDFRADVCAWRGMFDAEQQHDLSLALGHFTPPKTTLLLVASGNKFPILTVPFNRAYAWPSDQIERTCL
jgi:hypothetical protein